MTVRACRICGCTENRACVINDEPCSWISADVCSNPVCDAAAHEQLAARIVFVTSNMPPPPDAARTADVLLALVARTVGGHEIDSDTIRELNRG